MRLPEHPRVLSHPPLPQLTSPIIKNSILAKLIEDTFGSGKGGLGRLVSETLHVVSSRSSSVANKASGAASDRDEQRRLLEQENEELKAEVEALQADVEKLEDALTEAKRKEPQSAQKGKPCSREQCVKNRSTIKTYSATTPTCSRCAKLSDREWAAMKTDKGKAELLAGANQKLSDANKELTSVRAKVHEMETEMEKLRDQLKQHPAEEKVNELQASLAKANSERSALVSALTTDATAPSRLTIDDFKNLSEVLIRTTETGSNAVTNALETPLNHFKAVSLAGLEAHTRHHKRSKKSKAVRKKRKRNRSSSSSSSDSD